ncbi:MAG: SLC13 family permease [Anaerolineae bacterium]
MTPEMWLTLGILVAAIVLFVTEWLRVDVVALLVLVTLMLAGILTTEQALAGFSSSVVITIAALFVVGGAVLQTGVADLIGQRILRIAGTEETRLVLVIMLAVALLSGFMSDTGTVAVLLPAIISLARAAEISPSKLLIPLSYGALLGGAMTLIGTPPNIVVSDLLAQSNQPGFGFFSFTPAGLILVAAGVMFMITVGRRLLPDHKGAQDLERVTTPRELIDLYRLPDNLYRLRVLDSSSLRGRTLREARLRDLGISVLQILRHPQPRSVAQFAGQQIVLQPVDEKALQPDPDARIESGDTLVVQGEPDDVRHAAASLGLSIVPRSDEQDEQIRVDQEVGIAELLLPPRSRLVGKTLVDLNFGRQYRLSVLSINRPGVDGKLDLKTTPLQFGDILLVQGMWRDILALRRQRRDFVVMGQPEAMIGAPNRPKAPLAFLILVGMLVIMVADLMPVALASLVAAMAMVLTGCLSMDDAYAAIDWKSIVLIAGMLPMAVALEEVGLVDLAARALSSNLGALGPLAIMAGLFVVTSIFTQVLSNTATAVLIGPIALATAQQLGVNPQAFMMAVAIAASMAFATPVASPVNTLVMGAGNYRFADYIKVGVPMIGVMLVASLVVLPLLFPFY